MSPTGSIRERTVVQGTISIVKRPDTASYRIRFYRNETPDLLRPATAYIARGVAGLEVFLEECGMHSDTQRLIKDALKSECFANVLDYRVPDDVLKRYGLM